MGTRRVVVVGYDGADLLDISAVTSTLAIADQHGAAPAYDVRVASRGGHPITCPPDLRLAGGLSLERCIGPLDTLIVAGGPGYDTAAEDGRLVGHVRRLARESSRVASVCTGAAVLAATGLLDGRRATTHWEYARQIADRYPRVIIDPDPIYVRDGRFATAAGITSALDLTLAFLEEDHGADLARRVARSLVTYLQRPGSQAQMSMHLSAPPAEHGPVRHLVEHITGHLDGDLSAARLAADAGISERHLARLFRAHLGQAPGQFVRRARAEAAAQLLASTALPTARVAARCGFGSAEALRQAFVARYKTSPTRYRAMHGTHPVG